MAMRSGLPGVATGLAWTPAGGDILFIEAAAPLGAAHIQPLGTDDNQHHRCLGDGLPDDVGETCTSADVLKIEKYPVVTERLF